MKRFDMWVKSLFCTHEWNLVNKFDFNNLLDTITTEKCSKCEKEKGTHFYRANVFGPTVYKSDMSAKLANAEIERIKKLYEMKVERDWKPMEKEV
jgi:hypothetical protein